MEYKQHKLHLAQGKSITFEEGCERYLDYCRYRNLREGTINHYRQSYLNFFSHIDKNMLVRDFTADKYNQYVLDLKRTLHNDISINAYLRDLITVVHFWMNKDWLQPYKMTAIKIDRHHLETYSEEDLVKLLVKPDTRKCNFTEYSCWVQTSLLFSTGIRQRSLINLKIKDIDFDNSVLNVNVTKNRKSLIVPINSTMLKIFDEYLSLRPYTSKEDYLFVNIFGKKLCKSTHYHQLFDYNKHRGVETTGIHRYRHTFAKQWILSGGNVVTLSRLLGHSSLDITENYIHLLVSDLSKDVQELNLLDKYQNQRLNKIHLKLN